MKVVLIPLLSLIFGVALGWVFRGSSILNKNAEPLSSASTKSERGSYSSGGSSSFPGASASSASSSDRLLRGTASANFSSDDISSLGKKIMDTWDPIERGRLFDLLLSQLTVDNAQEVRDQIVKLGSDSTEFKNFHYAWGQIAGKEALIFGLESKEYDGGHIFRGWASANPDTAQSWLESIDYENDPSFESLRERGASKERIMRYLQEQMIKGSFLNDPVRAANYLASLPESDYHFANEEAEDLVEDLMTRGGIQAAQEWVSHLGDGKVATSAIGEIADEWSETDPDKALDWAMTQSDEDARHSALYNVWRNMASGRSGEDPFEVAERINAMPASADKDSALYGISSGMRRQYPESAVDAALSISDPELQERSLVHAGSAFLRAEPRAAKEWLANSGLSEDLTKQIMSRSRSSGGRRR